MTPDQADALTAILETMDRRLSGFGERFVNVESNMAESASATDKLAENSQKLIDLYLALDTKIDEVKTLVGNYVEATKSRERQARQTEEAAKGLVSEVRKRLPEVEVG